MDIGMIIDDIPTNDATNAGDLWANLPTNDTTDTGDMFTNMPANTVSSSNVDTILNSIPVSTKPPNPLSKEAMFVSKLLSTVSSNGNYDSYKVLRNGYDEYLLNGIPDAIKQFAETGKSISSPIFQLVFNLEDMLDDVYKKAKDDARIEILTELEAVYALKKRGESSSSYSSSSSSDDNIEIDQSHHINMEDLI